MLLFASVLCLNLTCTYYMRCNRRRMWHNLWRGRSSGSQSAILPSRPLYWPVVKSIDQFKLNATRAKSLHKTKKVDDAIELSGKSCRLQEFATCVVVVQQFRRSCQRALICNDGPPAMKTYLRLPSTTWDLRDWATESLTAFDLWGGVQLFPAGRANSRDICQLAIALYSLDGRAN